MKSFCTSCPLPLPPPPNFPLPSLPPHLPQFSTSTFVCGFSVVAGITVRSPMLAFYFAVALLIAPIGAQVSPPGTYAGYPYATFTPSMAIIIIVLVAAVFFMGFFSIYIRHCSDDVGGGGAGILIRSRRGAAAGRGLDLAVIETFPTFSHAEVKDHKIGKGALECAVCLSEFGEDETLRLIPRCDHVFHPECIGAWLESHVTCPVCRANLLPSPGEETVQEARPATTDGDRSESGRSRTDESPVRADVAANRNPAFELPGGLPRSWSIRPTRVFGFGRFRSHSTGHSLVQPGENLDRFTLRLPAEIRREVIGRAALNRASTLPREGSSTRGGGEGNGSSRTGRFYRRSDRATKSDRWDFLTRGFSVRSTKVVAEAGGGGGSSRGLVRMPSLRCLEPKGVDRDGLFSGGPSRPPV